MKKILLTRHQWWPGFFRLLLLLLAMACFSRFMIHAQAMPLFVEDAGDSKNTKLGYFQMLTGEEANSEKSRWDRLYQKNKGYVFGTKPSPLLEENWKRVPLGRVLDLGMGEGRHAVFMAKRGYEVTGIDISEVAVQKARRLARENRTRLKAVVADLNKYKLEENAYEGVLVFYFLDRSLTAQIKKTLKHGGILFFENNTTEQLKHDKAFNPEYLLKVGELREMFRDFEIIKYEETDDGKNAVASLIARKP